MGVVVHNSIVRHWPFKADPPEVLPKPGDFLRVAAGIMGQDLIGLSNPRRNHWTWVETYELIIWLGQPTSRSQLVTSLSCVMGTRVLAGKYIPLPKISRSDVWSKVECRPVIADISATACSAAARLKGDCTWGVWLVLIELQHRAV